MRGAEENGTQVVNVERREEWRRDSRGGWKPQEKGKKTLGK
jgi:hypothetical protein